MRLESTRILTDRLMVTPRNKLLEGCRILVAHAAATQPGYLLQALQNTGADLLWAGGTREALAHYRSRSVDLVIVEITLPSFGGWGVLRTMRAQADIPLIVFGPDDDRIEVACLAGGADDYLSYQSVPAVLLARVQALLRRAENRGRQTPKS